MQMCQELKVQHKSDVVEPSIMVEIIKVRTSGVIVCVLLVNHMQR
jgi:hypothetical protein